MNIRPLIPGFVTTTQIVWIPAMATPGLDARAGVTYGTPD